MNIPIIEMKSEYPFGESPQVEDSSEYLVHKELPFANQEQKEMVAQMVHFIKTIKHPYLVNLANTTEEPNACHLYYEYVPIKLESWLLAVNPDLTEDLEEQLLELT